MKNSDKEALKESLYFLKKEELAGILEHLELSGGGKKEEMINRIFRKLGIEEEFFQETEAFSLPKKHPKNATEKTHIIEGLYTNGKESRERLKSLIGDHFKFTLYGMNWIKKCWEKEIYPSYESFASYWTQEYERRKKGGEFAGPKTNRRVLFFREHQGRPKKELEELWKKERNRHVERAYLILRLDRE